MTHPEVPPSREITAKYDKRVEAILQARAIERFLLAIITVAMICGVLALLQFNAKQSDESKKAQERQDQVLQEIKEQNKNIANYLLCLSGTPPAERTSDFNAKCVRDSFGVEAKTSTTGNDTTSINTPSGSTIVMSDAGGTPESIVVVPPEQESNPTPTQPTAPQNQSNTPPPSRLERVIDFLDNVTGTASGAVDDTIENTRGLLLPQ